MKEFLYYILIEVAVKREIAQATYKIIKTVYVTKYNRGKCLNIDLIFNKSFLESHLKNVAIVCYYFKRF